MNQEEIRAQRRLQEMQERFLLLIDSVTDYAIFTLDTNGHYDSWNLGAERMLGHCEEEVIGQPSALIFTPEDIAQDVPEAEMKQALAVGRVEEERWHVRRDGSRFWASGVLTPLRDQNGRICGYAKIMRDLTQQKLSEEYLRISEERYRLILENVQDYAIFTLDKAGYVTSWNEGARRIKGYATGEIIGRHVSIFYPAEYLREDKPQREMERAEREGHSEDESWRIRKDGTRFWGNEIMTPLRDEKGRLHGFVKITRDLTQRKQSEEERAAAERHSSVLAERNRMGQELHDTLAQGFAGIRFQLDAAEEALSDAPEEVRAHIIRAREIAVQSLAEARRSIRALRSQMLEEARLSVGLERLRERADTSADAEIVFMMEGEEYALVPEVESDLFRIAQEALTNAVRHARAKQITLTLTYAPDRVRLEIWDDGRGFDTQASAGFGLNGLQERAQRMGAELAIESAPGQGTRVSVSLPVTAVSRKDKAPV